MQYYNTKNATCSGVKVELMELVAKLIFSQSLYLKNKKNINIIENVVYVFSAIVSLCDGIISSDCN